MNTSYQRAIKSCILLAGGQVINIVFGIVRTKALAMIVGPAGVGVAELYRSATATIGSIAGCGLASSGVRRIAEAHGTENSYGIAKTAAAMRRISLITGIVGTLAVLVLSLPLSVMSFSDGRHTIGLGVVSLSILFANVGAAQYALLQGMGRMRELAKSQIVGAAVGTALSVVVVYWLGPAGIPLYLVLIAFASAFGSYYYARQIELPFLHLSWQDMRGEVRAMLGLGLAFLVSGFMSTTGNYLTRILVLRKFGVDAVGLYQATWTLSGLYVGFVITAMGTDFYPRLTGAVRDGVASRRLINEQTEVGLLLALPGVLCTLVLAPWLLGLFYSKSFVAAGDIVRWHIMGVPLQVATYPLGYLPIAMNRGQLYLIKEILVLSMYLVFLATATALFGFAGVGYYYFVARCVHLAAEYFIARKLIGFHWSPRNVLALSASITCTSITLLTVNQIQGGNGVVVGLAVVVAASSVCAFTLARLMGGGFWRQRLASFLPK